MNDSICHTLRDYETGRAIGTAILTPAQFAHYRDTSSVRSDVYGHTLTHRLGALPHHYYALHPDHQDTSPDTTVYLY